MNVGPADAQKLYQQIARRIAASIEDGRYAPGDRLPSERELADDFGVSRPTIRDAMIALEFQGLVEARQGSGVYVKAAPQIAEDAAERDVSALELAEARRLFEGEACALAAAIITEEQVARLESLIAEMTQEMTTEELERRELEFHLMIARAICGERVATVVATLLASIERLPARCVHAIQRRRDRRCMVTWRR
jgi:DNA-binding FadR family transcriptional regulator